MGIVQNLMYNFDNFGFW